MIPHILGENREGKEENKGVRGGLLRCEDGFGIISTEAGGYVSRGILEEASWGDERGGLTVWIMMATDGEEMMRCVKV